MNVAHLQQLAVTKKTINAFLRIVVEIQEGRKYGVLIFH